MMNPETQTPSEDTLFHYASDSAMWQIARERALLITGAKVLLMQLAHPLIAESVYNHSYFFENPIRRFHRTLTLSLGMAFGTRIEVAHSVAEIEQAHRPATGRITETVGKHKAGTVYNPRNPRQGLWVLATLIEGAVTGYEQFVAPLSPERKEAFYADWYFIGEKMGIPESRMPPSYTDLLDYMATAIATDEISVGDKAQAMAPYITGRTIPLVNIVSYPVFRLSVGLLPEPIRSQYGYQFGNREQALLNATMRLSRATVPHLPSFLRYAYAYQRAMRLLKQ